MIFLAQAQYFPIEKFLLAIGTIIQIGGLMYLHYKIDLTEKKINEFDKSEPEIFVKTMKKDFEEYFKKIDDIRRLERQFTLKKYKYSRKGILIIIAGALLQLGSIFF